MDTAVHWLIYARSYNDTACTDATWAFEPIYGDVPELAEVHGVPTSPAYPFYGKIYCVVTPGNDWYDDLGEFDCTPASFDLKNGEILIITLIKEND